MALGELKNGIGPDAYAIYQQVLAAVVERDHPWQSVHQRKRYQPGKLIGGTWERIEDCTIWGASDTHPAGTKLEAGLPNIAAQVNDMLFSSSEPYITSDVFKPLLMFYQWIRFRVRVERSISE